MRIWITVLLMMTLMILLLVALRTGSPVKTERYFHYANLFKSKQFLGIDIDSEQISLGDLAYHAIFCNDHHQYICFSSKAINFAIPRVPKYLSDYWELNGIQYKLLKTELVWLMGQQYSVYRIESEQRGIWLNFLYSYEIGLIGFQATMGKSVGNFLTTEKTGFGSSAK